jgi:hypothetical protein
VAVTPSLVVVAPRELSIVGWRVEPPALDREPERLERLRNRIIDELERRGIALVSSAKLQDGRTAVRARIVNFRTGPADIEGLVTACPELREELTSSV